MASAEAIESVAGPKASPPGRLFCVAAVLAVLITAGHGLATWIGSCLHCPDDPLALQALLRPGGDPDYYPMLRNFAEGILGEPSYLESYGQGIDPYPIWSLLPHAACIRAFGLPGYVVADVLVNLAFLGLLWLLLRAFRLGPLLALGTALLVTVGLPQEFLVFAKSAGWLPEALQLNFWDARIPREFVTGVYVLLVWTCLIRLATDRSRVLRPGPWLWLGFSLSLLLQSETFAAVNGCILTGLASTVVLLQNRGHRRRILLCAALGAGVFAVASIPFFLQQLLTHPDAVCRYGIFSVPRTRPLVSFACHRRLAETGVLAAAAFVVLPRLNCRGAIGLRRIRRQVFSIGVAVVVSFLALPVSCVVLGKAGHVYHFDMFIEVVCSYAVLLLLLIAIGGRGHEMASRPTANRRPWLCSATVTATVFVVLAAGSVVVWQTLRRPDPPFRWLVPDATGEASRPSADRYWSDFRDVLRRLRETPELRRAEVLGALDTQVLNWWGAFGPRWQFLAQAWLTPGSDQVQERRLLLFCRLLGLRDEQLPRFLQLYYIKASLLGCAKYQACRAKTFSPLDDYEPADRAVILTKSVDDSWHIVVPKSEIRRLQLLYAQTTWKDCELHLPDVVVLTACERSLGLCAPAPEYGEALRNSTFSVWVRRRPEQGDRPRPAPQRRQSP